MIGCLPIAALWWYPSVEADGPRRVIAPAGLAVHAVAGGRVTSVDRQAVGAVVVRDEAERFHHYGRLRASSIDVMPNDLIDEGAVIGVIAAPSDGGTPAMFYGIADVDDVWLDVETLLVGASDPAEFPGVGVERGDPLVEAALPGPIERRPSTSVEIPRDKPPSPSGPESAAQPAGSLDETADDTRGDSSADTEDEPVLPEEVLPEPEPSGASGPEPDPGEAIEPESKPRSRLAARRPPRRPS